MMNPNSTPSNHRNDRLPPEAEPWLQEHPEADRDALEQAWKLAGLADDSAEDFDPDRIRSMEARIAAATRAGDRPAVQPRRRMRVAVRWAVAAVVVAVGITLFWMRPVSITAPVGEIVAVDLPDGSTVELNSGSRLSYPRRFGSRTRAVRLSGEGFFDVEPGPTPFEVETFNSTITVLGTRFNVQAWPEADTEATTVALEEGRVRFASDENPTQAIVLDPNQMSQVTTGHPSPPTLADWQTTLAWREGGFQFSDASLGEVLDELERRTGARIIVTDPGIRSLRASILLDRVENAEVVLTILTEMRGLNYSRDGNTYTLNLPQ